MADMLNRTVEIDDFVVFTAPYGGIAIGKVVKLTPKGYTVEGKRRYGGRVRKEKCNRPFADVLKVSNEEGELAWNDFKKIEIIEKLK